MKSPSNLRQTAALIKATREMERKRCASIARFAEQHCTTPVGQGVANAIAEAIENSAATSCQSGLLAGAALAQLQ